MFEDFLPQPEVKQKQQDLTQIASDFAWRFGNSAVHAGAEQPINGLSQLANQIAGKELVPQLSFTDVDHSDQGVAEVLGGAVGAMVPLVITKSALRGGGGLYNLGKRSLGLSEHALVRSSEIRMLAHSVALGLANDAVFVPVQADSANFLGDRMKNGVVGALTFGSLTG